MPPGKFQIEDYSAFWQLLRLLDSKTILPGLPEILTPGSLPGMLPKKSLYTGCQIPHLPNSPNIKAAALYTRKGFSCTRHSQPHWGRANHQTHHPKGIFFSALFNLLTRIWMKIQLERQMSQGLEIPSFAQIKSKAWVWKGGAKYALI